MAQEEQSKRFISESLVPLKFRQMVEEQEIRIKEESLYEQYNLCKQNGNFVEAIGYLLQVIEFNNTPERRAELRELYTDMNDGDIDTGYLKVINANIEGAKSDFVLYLKSQQRMDEAIYWLVDDGRVNEALHLINLNDLHLLDVVIDKIKGKNDDITDAILFVKNNIDEFTNMCNCVQPPRFIGIKYLFLHFLYALWRAYKLRGFIGLCIFPAILIITMKFHDNALISINMANGIPSLFLPIVCLMDIYSYHRWVKGIKHWKLMPEILYQHPQIVGINTKFLNGINQTSIPITFILVTP